MGAKSAFVLLPCPVIYLNDYTALAYSGSSRQRRNYLRPGAKSRVTCFSSLRTLPVVATVSSVLLVVAAAVYKWRRSNASVPLPRHIVRQLKKVDPALACAAETVWQVWQNFEHELAPAQGDNSGSTLSDSKSGLSLINLLVVGRLGFLDAGRSNLPLDRVVCVKDSSEIDAALRWVKFAVAAYGLRRLTLMRLVELRKTNSLHFQRRPSRDIAAAALFLGIPAEQILACGSDDAEDHHEVDNFCPWWLLIRDGQDLILSIRGSVNIGDVATDLACDEEEFLHGHAHRGIANAAAAVWKEAQPAVEAALAHPRDLDSVKGEQTFKQFIICGHSLGGGVALLLGMKLKSEACLPLPVLAFAAGTPPVFAGEFQKDVEEACMVVVNRLDIVPHLSLSSALRTLKAAAHVQTLGVSLKQKLEFLGGLYNHEQNLPKFSKLWGNAPSSCHELRIPGRAVWLVDACAGREVLAVEVTEDMQQVSQVPPELWDLPRALGDHLPDAYVRTMQRAQRRYNLA